MLLTRECDYAVRILRALSKGDLVSVSEISKEEDISVQITYKLARKLEHANLLQSQRGVNGGYRLAKPLLDISLYDVFEAVEQKVAISECSQSKHGCSRDKKDVPCTVHREFCRIQQMVETELKRKSLVEIMSGQ